MSGCMVILLVCQGPQPVPAPHLVASQLYLYITPASLSPNYKIHTPWHFLWLKPHSNCAGKNKNPEGPIAMALLW